VKVQPALTGHQALTLLFDTIMQGHWGALGQLCLLMQGSGIGNCCDLMPRLFSVLSCMLVDMPCPADVATEAAFGSISSQAAHLSDDAAMSGCQIPFRVGLIGQSKMVDMLASCRGTEKRCAQLAQPTPLCD